MFLFSTDSNFHAVSCKSLVAFTYQNFNVSIETKASTIQDKAFCAVF